MKDLKPAVFACMREIKYAQSCRGTWKKAALNIFVLCLLVCSGALAETGGGIFGGKANKGVLSLIEFKGALYAGTWNDDEGCQLWRSFSGDKWEIVSKGGFGDSGNVELLSLGVFKGSLYAGGRNYERGAFLYRSLDGERWESVFIKGLRESGARDIAALCEFKGELYAGAGNEGVTEDKASLWRSSDGMEWSDCGISLIAQRERMKIIYLLYPYKDHLYLLPKTEDTASGFLRTPDGKEFETIKVPGSVFSSYNGAAGLKGWMYLGCKSSVKGNNGGVIRSSDGRRWEFADDGLSGKRMLKVDSMAVFNDDLYCGIRHETGSGMRKSAVLKSSDGIEWADVSSEMCAETGNLLIDCFTEFKGALYAGVWNFDSGMQIWRLKRHGRCWERVF